MTGRVRQKAAFALPAALSLVSANPPLDAPTVGPNNPLVAKVSCAFNSGTAFRIGRYTWLSVAHVTKGAGCTIGGEPFKLEWNDPKRDFAILHLEKRPGKGLAIDCQGFKRGRIYLAIGHARGLDVQTTIPLVATGDTDDGFAVLRGIWTVIPGQSGGPIIDRETGKVVGTVNVYVPHMGLSGSIPLSETSVCADA